MAKSKKKRIPGSIYLNKNRYWWKVKLPGEKVAKAMPLKPLGANVATVDYNVALECASMIYAKAIFEFKESKMEVVENVAELIKAYFIYADEYYRDCEGKTTQELTGVKYALKPLIELFANTPLDEFGPLKLDEVRRSMIKADISRKLINKRISIIKRVFRWGVSRQLVSPMVFQGLCALDGLRRGRSSAREIKPVQPVKEEHVRMVLPYTTPVIRAMIEIQLLTGMRPGELVRMKPKEIDRSQGVWHYYPEKHKNEFRGLERVVSIGPKGQEILTPFLLRNKEEYCFSPIESEVYRRRLNTLARKTPLSCGNKIGTNRKENPQKSPGKCYDSNSYRKSVQAAIKAAQKEIKMQGGDPDVELPFWTPYRLRHTAATKVRKLFNYETAGALLGHSNMSATAIYAERNQGLADDVAKKFG